MNKSYAIAEIKSMLDKTDQNTYHKEEPINLQAAKLIFNDLETVFTIYLDLENTINTKDVAEAIVKEQRESIEKLNAIIVDLKNQLGEATSKSTKPSSFSNYLHATTVREKAYERYNYAASALKLAKIEERLAEIKSQHEPVNSLGQRIICNITARESFESICDYVVLGKKVK